jgi:transglutaminase-like putative cysteine protease
MVKTKYILLLVMTLFAVVASAQSSDVWTKATTTFPHESAVFVERTGVTEIFVKNDSLQATTEHREDILHLREQTDQFAVQRVYGSHFFTVRDLEAKTLVWAKNKYKPVTVSEFKRNSDRHEGIFFDDSYYYSFDFPLIAPQNRTQLSYKEDLKDVRFLSGFVFGSYMPQLRTEYQIRTTKDVEFFFEVLNDPDNKIKFNTVTKGNTITYTWQAENLPALKSEENSPSIRYYAPHLICYVKSYKNKGAKQNVLSSADDLHRSYFNYLKDLDAEPSQELKTIVAELKSNSQSELDFVKNVFYWVQKNIHYIAFEQGMRGFIPHHASYVCEKRYGDCKDMANMIVTMLRIGGVKSFHTWIGTRDLPYSYTKFPTPLTDNHMIATYVDPNGKYYFLDGTSNYTVFGLPSSMIQGKEALISKSNSEFEIHTVPEIPAEQNIMVDSTWIAIDNQQMIGKGTVSLMGYPKIFASYKLDRTSDEEIRKYMVTLLSRGNNKFFLDKYDFKNLQDYDKPIRMKYDYRIQDYFKKAAGELYINLNLNKDFYNAIINRELRNSPIEIDYRYMKREYTEFQIPDGYDVEYVPANSSFKGKFLGYDMQFSRVGKKIVLTKSLYVDYLLLTAADFENWNESVRKISEAYKESIILKQKI